MKLYTNIFVFLLACSTTASTLAVAGDNIQNKWNIGDPILSPGPPGSYDEVAVKDPSIVFFEGMWHVFYTARSKIEYSTAYVSAKSLSGLQSAPRHKLNVIRGKKNAYGCAPQILYFQPQQKWYLIFQTLDSNYQPAFSTTETISDPQSWSNPQHLLKKDSSAKWIDFWVICDNSKAYLFYTQAHHGVIVRSTDLKDFPRGWSKPKKVFDNIHEAVHIYKVKGRQEYHMIYELHNKSIRSFGIASSHHLQGPWKKVTDNYATGNQLQSTGKAAPWTEMVSHGEVLRSGHNQQMQYDPKNCKWLIQGILKKDSQMPYPSLPWKLGIMEREE